MRRLLPTITAIAALAGVAWAPAPLLTAPQVTPECASILNTVEATRLYLPGNFAFHCPDGAAGNLGRSVFNGTTGWVELNTDAIAYYGVGAADVMAHETCHAWQQSTTGTTTEQSADACAVAHGFHVAAGGPPPLLVAP